MDRELLGFVAFMAVVFCVLGWAPAFSEDGGVRWDALCASRIGSSRVVDSSGDVWLVAGVTSDQRGLLIVAECANESGLCHGRVSALVPLEEVKEVRP